MKNSTMGSRRILLTAVAISTLAACGGGGGSGTPTTATLSGTVVDGYIEGAKVCLDVNANGACDNGEPSATTDASGKYKLDVGTINTSGLNIIADIPDTAKDSDDNGQTLAQAGKSAYTMLTTASEPTVVTPLTTLIAGKVKTDSVSIAVAKTRVLEELGLPPETNPHEDHVAAGNTVVHGAARQVAAQLQKAQQDLPQNTAPAERWTKLADALKKDQDDAGALVGAATNLSSMPQSLSNVATGKLIAYKMPGSKGQLINATAMVFVPKTSMPQGGWPLLVFGHGTVGVARSCAPSVTMQASGSWDYADLVASLVTGGGQSGKEVVVVAPDYEGLGPDAIVPAGHPYLNLGSAGRSMALSAVAAKKLLTTQLNGSWATLGHSQGGHAALAGAQFADLAKKQEPLLAYKGAVAIAPASNLLFSLNSMWESIQAASANVANYSAGYGAVGVSNMYASYVIKGTESTPTPVPAANALGARMLALHNSKVASECLTAYSGSIGADVTQYAGTNGATPQGYTGVINSAMNTPEISKLLASYEPGQVKLPGKTLIVQGDADTTVLPSATTTLKSTMLAKGSTVAVEVVAGKGHSSVLLDAGAQTKIAVFLTGLFTPSN